MYKRQQYQWAVKRGWEGIGEPMLTTWDELATRLQLPVAFAGEIDAAAAKLLRRSNRSAIIAPPAESVRRAATLAAVSYTHLDVYKRQLLDGLGLRRHVGGLVHGRLLSHGRGRAGHGEVALGIEFSLSLIHI